MKLAWLKIDKESGGTEILFEDPLYKEDYYFSYVPIVYTELEKTG